MPRTVVVVMRWWRAPDEMPFLPAVLAMMSLALALVLAEAVGMQKNILWSIQIPKLLMVCCGETSSPYKVTSTASIKLELDVVVGTMCICLALARKSSVFRATARRSLVCSRFC